MAVLNTIDFDCKIDAVCEIHAIRGWLRTLKVVTCWESMQTIAGIKFEGSKAWEAVYDS